MEGSLLGSAKSYVGFDLDVNGDGVTGEAYISGWNFARIAGGRVDGNRVRFSVNQVEFEGSIDGDAMSLQSIAGGSFAATLRRTQSEVTGPISVEATAKDLEGAWKTRWTGRIGARPKTIGDLRIEFKEGANGLTGVAHMGAFPGDCSISDVKLEGGRISFTATGGMRSSSGVPVTRFEGEIHGSQLKLTMMGLPLDAVKE